MQDASRTPVIIGVGQVADRTADPDAALDTVGLIASALVKADQDAGGRWLPKLDSLSVIEHVSFRGERRSHVDVAAQLGIAPVRLERGTYPGGETPVLLLNQAANLIGTGEVQVAAIAGGEALRTESLRRSRSLASGSKPPNALEELAKQRQPTFRSRYGLDLPTSVYPLYENAGRASDGQTLREAQQETSAIWALSSRVAAGSPDAWIQRPYTADEIGTVTESNRPVAFPYSKLMVANSSVNMGAAMIVTSLATARAAGVPDERLVFVGLGAAANEPEDFLEREGYDRSVALETSITRALKLNEIAADELDWVELYSCFPTVTKMARRVIEWPLDRPTTVYGGLTFGGGPIAAPMAHAIAAMVAKIRSRRNSVGLIFGNGGFANHNHSIVLSGLQNPAVRFPQAFDYQQEADARRTPAPTFKEGYVGAGQIETYTVFYDRDGRFTFGVVICLTPDHRQRFLAKVPGTDAAQLEWLTSGRSEPVGTDGEAFDDGSGDIVWRSRH